jgi:glycosyltransferase involved in cell wall biosynthesis
VKPIVSVVLCTWNRRTVLPAALNALTHQDATVPYEVIAVNNASTDRTWEVIAEAARRSPDLLRCIDEPQQGLSYARNAGVRAARGDIIAFTDDDVRVSPDWVRTIAMTLDAHPDADWIGGPVLPDWGSPPPAWITRERWAPLGLQDHGADPIVVGAGRPICLIGANLAFRAHVFDLVGGFSTSVQRVEHGIGSTEDHEFERRLWVRGRTGIYTPNLVVRAAVEGSRLERRYHRDWHRGHGHYLARMCAADVEAFGGRRIADVPLHLLRTAVKNSDARAFASGFISERLRTGSPAVNVESGLASVVIPCFNHARFLGEAIDSACAQRRDIQVIVVDDGSTDESSRIAARFPNVELLRQRHRGVSRARNTGLRAAAGEFILFLDADDRLLPRALDVLQQALAGTPGAAFAYGRFHDIDEHGHPLTSERPVRRAQDDFEALVRSNFICVPGAVLYRTAAVRTAGGFTPRIDAAADYELHLRLARKYPIVGTDREVVEYRRHGSNMSADPAMMLRTTLRAHRVHGRAAPSRAHAAGRRYWREFYGAQLLEQVRGNWHEGRILRALRGSLWLLLLAPSVLAGAVAQRVRIRKTMNRLSS